MSTQKVSDIGKELVSRLEESKRSRRRARRVRQFGGGKKKGAKARFTKYQKETPARLQKQHKADALKGKIRKRLAQKKEAVPGRTKVLTAPTKGEVEQKAQAKISHHASRRAKRDMLRTRKARGEAIKANLGKLGRGTRKVLGGAASLAVRGLTSHPKATLAAAGGLAAGPVGALAGYAAGKAGEKAKILGPGGAGMYARQQRLRALSKPPEEKTDPKTGKTTTTGSLTQKILKGGGKTTHATATHAGQRLQHVQRSQDIAAVKAANKQAASRDKRARTRGALKQAAKNLAGGVRRRGGTAGTQRERGMMG
jgi:hypothetical protein